MIVHIMMNRESMSVQLLLQEEIKMAEDKKYYEEISPEDLEGVSGGRIKLTGYALLRAYMWQMKELNHNKEETVEDFIDSWNKNCEFRTRFTDGTDADLQSGIDFINRYWK